MKYLFLFTGLAFSLVTHAQIKSGKKKTDSTSHVKINRDDYIQMYPNHFFIWPVLKQRTQNYELKTTKPEKRTIGYYSNKPYSLGIGMYLFEVAAEITFAIPLNEKSKTIYGESKSSNLQLILLGKKWGADGYFQQYQGFYLKDSDVPVPANTPYLQRPDIKTQNIGLNVNYNFNYNKFSFRAAYNYSERQLRSAGSFLLFASLDNFKISGDSALIGKDYEGSFLEPSKIEKINSWLVGVLPGYTYSVVYEGFFINGTLGLGPAYNFLNYTLEDIGTKSKSTVNALVALKISAGYNGDRFFGGMIFGNQIGNTKIENLNVTSSIASFKILVGYRILERGILKKRAKDLQDEIMD
jgi:hypothetical protein